MDKKMNFKEMADRRLGGLTVNPQELVRTARVQRRNKRGGYKAVIAAAALFCLVVTVSASAWASGAAERAERTFYIRHISHESMAVRDAMAEIYGAQIYFDALESDDIHEQYIAMNKLVEYYNEPEIRAKAAEGIAPFLTHAEEKLRESAEFTLSILRQEFTHPQIVHLAGGDMVFTLFQNYSDYGSYNELWMIKDGVLEKYWSLEEPYRYITGIYPSPNGTKFAFTTASNKSGGLIICDHTGGFISPELVESVKAKAEYDLGYDYWHRTDHENYCGVSAPEWLDEETIAFEARLMVNDLQEAAQAACTFRMDTKELVYEIISR